MYHVNINNISMQKGYIFKNWNQVVRKVNWFAFLQNFLMSGLIEGRFSYWLRQHVSE